MCRLEGKVALVTGGNSGIGLVTAQRLYAKGARVAISGRNRESLAQAAGSLGADGLAVRADMSNISDLEMLFTEVAQKLGKIDVLFINAGIAKFGPIEAVTEQQYDEQVGINMKGSFFTIQKALPHLNDGASIILNTSVASHKGRPSGSVYAATKAAMRSLTRSAAAALVGRKIRVNAVAPGPIRTALFDRTGISQEALEGVLDALLADVPMKRFGTPEEVAAVVAFLASPDASYITGVEIDPPPRGAGSSKNSSWSARTEEMSGGQHRDDEANGPSRSGEVKRKEAGVARAINSSATAQTHGCAQENQKLRRNVLDGADFVRDVIGTYAETDRFPISALQGELNRHLV